MTAINPTTGHKLSESELDAEAEAEAEASRTTIQRCLFQTPASTKVHVYNIPPLASNRGHDAATWTADDNNRMIFMARLRVLETAITPVPPTSTSKNTSSTSNAESPGKPTLRADILLEDPSTGALFASCPYTSSASVMQAIGSSRFFALRVVSEGGMKATLGIGFEERADAFDFNTTLQDVRKLLGGFGVDATTGGRASVGRGNDKNNKQAGKSGEKEKFSDTFSALNLNGKDNVNKNSRIKVDLSASERLRARNTSAKSESEHYDISENNSEKADKKSSAMGVASISNQAVSSVGIPFLPPPPPPASSTSSASERIKRRQVNSNSGDPISNDGATPEGKADNIFNNVAVVSPTDGKDVDDDDDFGDFC